MVQPEFRCVEFVEMATDWMELALDDHDRVSLEEHVAICPHCSEYVEQLRLTIGVLREVRHEAPPPAARAALLEAFRQSR